MSSAVYETSANLTRSAIIYSKWRSSAHQHEWYTWWSRYQTYIEFICIFLGFRCCFVIGSKGKIMYFMTFSDIHSLKTDINISWSFIHCTLNLVVALEVLPWMPGYHEDSSPIGNSCKHGNRWSLACVSLLLHHPLQFPSTDPTSLSFGLWLTWWWWWLLWLIE